MANINDFRRRRLAAAAGRPEREIWWRALVGRIDEAEDDGRPLWERRSEKWQRRYARRRYWDYVLNKWTWRVVTAAIFLYLAVNLITGNGIFRNNETRSPWRDAAIQKGIETGELDFSRIRGWDAESTSTAVVEFSDEE